MSAISSTHDVVNVTVHGGFRASAKDLSRFIPMEVKSLLASTQARHVIFTGHSAGGAVASLLYMHYISGEELVRNRNRSAMWMETEAHDSGGMESSTKFSCITFGAPPVSSVDLTKAFEGRGYGKERGIHVAIMNEHDLVTRADRAYLRSLVDMYRASYSLSPVPHDRSTAADTRQDSDLKQDKISIAQSTAAETHFPMPKPLLWPFGTRVLLKMELVKQNEGERKELKAFKLSQDAYSRLIFTKIAMHKRMAYGDRMEDILRGKLNGNESW